MTIHWRRSGWLYHTTTWPLSPISSRTSDWSQNTVQPTWPSTWEKWLVICGVEVVTFWHHHRTYMTTHGREAADPTTAPLRPHSCLWERGGWPHYSTTWSPWSSVGRSGWSHHSCLWETGGWPHHTTTRPTWPLGEDRGGGYEKRLTTSPHSFCSRLQGKSGCPLTLPLGPQGHSWESSGWSHHTPHSPHGYL